MNEILFYGGMILACIFLLITILLFFYRKVYLAFSFFAHRKMKSIPKQPRANTSIKPRKSKDQIVSSSVTASPISVDGTEILDKTEDYTEILCDDATEVLE